MGLEILAKQMDGLKKQIPSQVNKATQSVAIWTIRAAIRSTRVDTGKAVSNWRVSIGEPENSDDGAYIPGKAGSTASQNRAIVRTNATAEIRKRKLGQDIYISNGVKYIFKLDSMDQMGRLAEQAGKARAAQIKLNLKLK